MCEVLLQFSLFIIDLIEYKLFVVIPIVLDLKKKKIYDKEAIGELDTQDIFLFDDYEDISLSIEYADQ